MNPPPPRLITHMILYLKSLPAKGRTPPADWLPWLEAMDKAMRDRDTVRIEISGPKDFALFLGIEDLEF